MTSQFYCVFVFNSDKHSHKPSNYPRHNYILFSIVCPVDSIHNKPATRLRNKQIMLRVSEAEDQKIRELAKNNGMKISEYLRHLLTNLLQND